MVFHLDNSINRIIANSIAYKSQIQRHEHAISDCNAMETVVQELALWQLLGSGSESLTLIYSPPDVKLGFRAYFIY